MEKLLRLKIEQIEFREMIFKKIYAQQDFWFGRFKTWIYSLIVINNYHPHDSIEGGIDGDQNPTLVTTKGVTKSVLQGIDALDFDKLAKWWVPADTTLCT